MINAARFPQRHSNHIFFLSFLWMKRERKTSTTINSPLHFLNGEKKSLQKRIFPTHPNLRGKPANFIEKCIEVIIVAVDGSHMDCLHHVLCCIHRVLCCLHRVLCSTMSFAASTMSFAPPCPLLPPPCSPLSAPQRVMRIYRLHWLLVRSDFGLLWVAVLRRGQFQ